MSNTDLFPREFDLARVTIEFTSPLTVSSAEDDDFVDSACVTDANGLPTIPGTSIAGVLRHALGGGAVDNDKGIDHLFGFQKGAKGEASRLWTSWAQIHGADDRPVPVRARADLLDRLRTDPVLAAAREGIVRDHVRISGRGVAADRGKFDERLVPAGARFTFELGLAKLDGPYSQQFSMAGLLALLARPDLRLGGRTRRGFGAFRVVRARVRHFELCKAADAEAWRALSADLSVDPSSILPRLQETAAGARPDVSTATLRVTPEDFFLVGGGDVEDWAAHTGLDARALEHVDRAPLTERAIVWTCEPGTGESRCRGAVEERPSLVVPATAIKGALRHRVLFHARALAGRTLGSHNADMHAECVELENCATEDPGATVVSQLFGTARGDSGQPGRVFVSDLRPAPRKPAVLRHVSLDRFSGGPMDGLLFGETVAWRDPAAAGARELEIVIDVDRRKVEPVAMKALDRALRDLCEGRLAIGAGANRGHGYFQGTYEWTGAPWAAGGGK